MGYKLPFWFIQLTLFNCCSISLFWLHHICPYSLRWRRQGISHCNRGIPMWTEAVFLLRLCPCASLCGAKLAGKMRAWCHRDARQNKKFASQPEAGEKSSVGSWSVSPSKLTLLRQAEQRDSKLKPGDDAEHQQQSVIQTPDRISLAERSCSQWYALAHPTQSWVWTACLVVNQNCWQVMHFSTSDAASDIVGSQMPFHSWNYRHIVYCNHLIQFSTNTSFIN